MGVDVLEKTAASLPYHEPHITIILSHSSFLLLLNIINYLLDKWIYCGLVGQIFVGVLFGTPGLGLLGVTAESTIVQLGYLGLILVVYEGGLSTHLPTLISNFPLSTLVALTGIIIPIALSFLLGPLANATPLQCFAAGAALSATSLGTTFSILSSSGLANTRLGTVLTSAAMMDDVIGLVMIQVVSNLGNLGLEGGIDGAVIGRPIAASVGLLVVVIVVCKFFVRPLHGALSSSIGNWAKAGSRLTRLVWEGKHTPFVVHTLLLLGHVAVAAYAGTSVLFAAFLQGAVVSWWDGCVAHQPQHPQPAAAPSPTSATTSTTPTTPPPSTPPPQTGISTFTTYLSPPHLTLLKPLFFASIAFSIPITKLFTPSALWRGLIYALLMTFAKLVTGIWLLHPTARKTSKKTKTRPPPESIYPSLILGLSMIARGEIGFLIAAVAEAEGIFLPNANSDPNPNAPAHAPVQGSSDAGRAPTATEASELYMLTIWAIVLCTVLGPVGVGLLVKRVRRLEVESERERERERERGAAEGRRREGEGEGSSNGSSANGTGENGKKGGTGGEGEEEEEEESGVLGVWGVNGMQRKEG